MKFLKLIILILISYNYCLGQQKNITKEIIIDEELFNLNSYPYKVENKNEKDINNIFIIENDFLKFRIAYGCGCGSIVIKLVSNGVIEQDNNKNNYIVCKLYFNSDNKCKAMCHDNLSFNISSLKSDKIHFIKFIGFEQLIKYSYKTEQDK